MKSLKIAALIFFIAAALDFTAYGQSALAAANGQEAVGVIDTLDGVQQAVVRIETSGSFWHRPLGTPSRRGTGTGFIINQQGYVVTNNHVVAGASDLRIWIDGESSSRTASIVAVAECSDLAVLDIDGEGFPHLAWYQQTISPNLAVHAAGFPFGTTQYTLSNGVISDTQAEGDSFWSSIANVIEHSAAISPGNSGGPLVDDTGKVVAINYLRSRRTGLSYAISQVEAAPIVATLSSGQDVNSIGISGESVPLTDDTVAIWISAVTPDTPASLLGLQPGDVIWNIDGAFLESESLMVDYCNTLKRNPSGQTLQLEIYRSVSGQFLSGQLNGRALTVVTPPSDTELPIPAASTSDAESSPSPESNGQAAAEGYAIVPAPNWSIASQKSQITLKGLEVEVELNSAAGSYLLVSAVGSEDVRFVRIDDLHNEVRQNLIAEGAVNRCSSIANSDLTYGGYDMTYSRWTNCTTIAGAAGPNEVYVMTAKSRAAPYHMVGLLGGFTATDNGYDVLLNTLSGLRVDNPPPRRSIIPQQPAPGQSVTATVLVEALNVRTGPGLQNQVLGQVYLGNSLTVIGKSNSCGWLQVITPTGVRGWVSGNQAYITLNGLCTGIN